MIITEAVSQGAEVCLAWRLALYSAIKSLSRRWGGKTGAGVPGFLHIFTWNICVRSVSHVISFGLGSSLITYLPCVGLCGG